jgi:hypothetical protein
MKESLKQPAPDVDLKPHSGLPAAGVISTEISPTVNAPQTAAEPRPLPFGVLSGKKKTPAAVSENLKP